jgi:hypothetical protein
LARITAKFLTQSNRRSVIQLRSADLHNRVEDFCLLFQRAFETNQTQQKILTDRFKRGYVNSAGDDIVTRLPLIHVIVRVYVLAAAIFVRALRLAITSLVFMLVEVPDPV